MLYGAYLTVVLTPIIIGSLLILAGLLYIIAPIIMERRLHKIGVALYLEDKERERREDLKDIVNTLEQLLERIDSRELEEKSIDTLFDFSDVTDNVRSHKRRIPRTLVEVSNTWYERYYAVQ